MGCHLACLNPPLSRHPEVAVKLSAPPPPPPEPPEPNPPGQPTPGESAPAGTPAAAADAPRVVAWPAWFAGADWLIAALAVTLAFLLASFVARNSDLWLHHAAGKRPFAGEYRPGADPYSSTAADAAWVKPSLLHDAGASRTERANDTAG